MRKNLLAMLLVPILTGLACVQEAGVHRGMLVGGSNQGNFTNYMLLLDAGNSPTTFRTTHGTGPWPLWGNIFGMTLDADNLTVVSPGVVGTSGPPYTVALVRFDPGARAVTSTLWSGTSSTANLTSYANWTMNADGDLITIDNARTPQVIAEYDTFAGTWSHSALPASLVSSGGISGVEVNPLDGSVNHVAWGVDVSAPSRLYSTSHDYSVTRTIASADTRRTRYGGTMVDNGDWISSTCCSNTYYIAKNGNATLAAGPALSGYVAMEVTHEKFAAPGRGVWFSNLSPRLVGYLDVVSNTVTTLFVGTPTTMPDIAFEVTPLYDRDLGSRRTGKAAWDLFINPGNSTFPGRSYVIAASLVSPPPGGIILSSRRQIFIGIDPLTWITVNGAVPPFLTGNAGTLDRSGRATAKLDFSTAGRTLNGLVLHFCAVVLDRAAPDGIGWVCDPHAFPIDVMP